MAHGFGRTKKHRLERFAQAFAAAGFVVLVHDIRISGRAEATYAETSIHGDKSQTGVARSPISRAPEVDPSLLGVSARKGTSCTLAASHQSKKSDTCSAAHTVEPAREGSGASGETARR